MGGSVTRSNHFYPPYYIADADIDEDDIYRAQSSWKMITNDTSPTYVELRGTEGFSHPSALAWFYTMFYDRLFDVHPSCKPLFRNNMKVQGQALCGIVTTALSLLKETEVLKGALTKLAIRHAKYGVLANQYGMVGEVLLWTLDKILRDVFDAKTQSSWVKIYSFMLQVIIPVAVEAEKKIFEERDREKGAKRKTLEQQSSSSSSSIVNRVIEATTSGRVKRSKGDQGSNTGETEAVIAL